MSNHLAYAIGKYGQAYYSLATEPDEIRDRLVVAWGHITAIPPDMVPDEIRDEVRWVYDKFTRKETPRLSLRGLHTPTCIDIAKRIITIYCKLNQLNSPDNSHGDFINRHVNLEINY